MVEGIYLSIYVSRYPQAITMFFAGVALFLTLVGYSTEEENTKEENTDETGKILKFIIKKTKKKFV